MKHMRFILLTLAAFYFAACSDRSEPSIPGIGDGNVTVGFNYTTKPPFIVEFTNTSRNATSYKWDFGDGESSTEKSPVHQYAGAGSYIATLTAISHTGTKYDARATIKVEAPKIYISGYALYAIPYENKYYKVVCKDDDWLKTTWGFTSPYTPLLDNTDIPYIEPFSTPKLMDQLSGDNYYTFYVYNATKTNTTSTDVQCMKQKLTKAEILTYKDEHVLKSDNKQTELHVLMEYK